MTLTLAKGAKVKVGESAVGWDHLDYSFHGCKVIDLDLIPHLGGGPISHKPDTNDLDLCYKVKDI